MNAIIHLQCVVMCVEGVHEKQGYAASIFLVEVLHRTTLIKSMYNDRETTYYIENHMSIGYLNLDNN